MTWDSSNMKRRRAHLLHREAGVSYTFDPAVGADLGFNSYDYRLYHRPSKQAFDRVVYCRNLNECEKLFAKWNDGNACGIALWIVSRGDA